MKIVAAAIPGFGIIWLEEPDVGKILHTMAKMLPGVLETRLATAYHRAKGLSEIWRHCKIHSQISKCHAHDKILLVFVRLMLFSSKRLRVFGQYMNVAHIIIRMNEMTTASEIKAGGSCAYFILYFISHESCLQ